MTEQATFRTERDSMGEMRVPAHALYAAQTQRAVENFPVSGWPLPPGLIHALGAIKGAAATVNADLGLLDPAIAAAIAAAAGRVADGGLDGQFPVDVFQTGSGTSSNMNANEVIATLASREAGLRVHPNDHVNMGQSSNDVFPGALHVAAVAGLEGTLIPALRRLHEVLSAKAVEFDGVVKIGRTHLMDAVPIRLGQEFSGYARQVELAIGRVGAALPDLRELAIGGTAVGTGLNTHGEFGARVAAKLSERYGTAFREAENHFEAQAGRDAYVFAAGTLTSVAATLIKIANDVRLLASGPQAGLGELVLPATQPGSSIMPGKVNPVMCETLMQVCAQVFGGDATITWAAAAGSNFELNVMMPVIAHHFLENVRILTNAVCAFTNNCVKGIEANVAHCNELVEYSMAMVTSLAPIIGYDLAAEIAKESGKTGRTVREICRERKVLPEAELEKALDPVEMTKPGGEGAAGG